MTPVFRKLNWKDQASIVVLNAPDSFEPELAALKGVTILRALAGLDEAEFSLAFVTKQKEVDTLAKAIGKKAKGEVFLASTDRVAIDAVGVAVLKHLGSNAAIMNSKIFAQEQIARAVELGLGVSSPAAIDLLAGDDPSTEYRNKIRAILDQG